MSRSPENAPSLNRRSFLSATGALGLSCLAPSPVANALLSTATLPEARPVLDGLGFLDRDLLHTDLWDHARSIAPQFIEVSPDGRRTFRVQAMVEALDSFGDDIARDFEKEREAISPLAAKLAPFREELLKGRTSADLTRQFYALMEESSPAEAIVNFVELHREELRLLSLFEFAENPSRLSESSAEQISSLRDRIHLLQWDIKCGRFMFSALEGPVRVEQDGQISDATNMRAEVIYSECRYDYLMNDFVLTCWEHELFIPKPLKTENLSIARFSSCIRI